MTTAFLVRFPPGQLVRFEQNPFVSMAVACTHVSEHYACDWTWPKWDETVMAAHAREHYMLAGAVDWTIVNGCYCYGLEQLAAGQIDWQQDRIMVALCAPGYEPDPQHHRFLTDVTHQITVDGYQPAVLAATTQTVEDTLTGPVVVLDANDVVWGIVTLYATRAVVYKDTGEPATSPLISCVRFDAAPPVFGGTFRLTWASDGIVRLNVDGELVLTREGSTP